MIDNDQLAKIRSIDRTPGSRRTVVVKGLYRVEDGPASMERRIDEMCREVDEAIAEGAQFIILSDRDSTDQLAPIPTLLMTSAVHHHLIQASTRMRAGIVVEAGDVREVHHVALLIGYGASAVNPYLAMETAEQLALSGQLGADVDTAVRNVIKGLGKGVTKIMSKMGISTVGAYGGAQAFEAIGLSRELVDRYFTGTHSPLGGVGLDVIAEENRLRHRSAYPDERAPDRARAAHDRRRVPVAPGRRSAPVQPRDGLQAAALHAHRALRRVPRVLAARRRPGGGAEDAPRAAAAAHRRGAGARSTRSSRSHRSCSASRPGR